MIYRLFQTISTVLIHDMNRRTDEMLSVRIRVFNERFNRNTHLGGTLALFETLQTGSDVIRTVL